ncbi:MAG: ribonuclease R [Thermoguttaceae bacterium]|jgi:ribonuclease R|nr:ribonuclease R [Thermoguttaceae bacterium]
MSESDLEQAILGLVQQPGYRPVKPRVLAQRLGLAKAQAAEVKRAVKRLVARGQLTYGSSHLVELPRARSQAGRVVGVFRRAEAGHGFVRPQRGAADDTPPRDIYIPAEKTGDAATGDTVAVRLSRSRGDLGPRGEIVEVLQRETHRFVGSYVETGGNAAVRIDGSVFVAPVFVGDPSAFGLRPGDKVVVEMVRFPTAWRAGEGVVVEVLGPRGRPGVDTLTILREFDLPESFPEDALDEARRQAEAFDETIPPGRLDLTGLTTITIDPADARDFDDAVSLEREEDGRWRLGVHIADVAHFVRPNSALDREARHRGTSVYLPDRVLPMLPEAISNALASLQPNKVRYTKTVFIEFDADGLPIHAEVHRSAIRSRKRLTYEQVDAFLEDPDAWRRKLGATVCDLLGRMRDLARILRRRRIARGALEMSIPEVKVDLDRQGRVTGAHVVAQTESYQIIEEFMLAANETVAGLLCDRGFDFLRRIHRPPAPRKLKALAEFVAELPLPGRPGARRLDSRFALQRILAEAAGRPEERAVHLAVLRSMQRAVYGPEEEGHYALASPCYCHFTSPIRRYPDLTIHRLVDALLAGRKPQADRAALVALGEHCSQREQRAESAERELTKLKLLWYLNDRIGEEMDAVITGVEPFGLFAQGIHLPAEGLIHVDSLADDFYHYDRTTHSLAGHRSGNTFRLGDVIRVAVAHVDLDRRELDFRVVGRRARRR